MLIDPDIYINSLQQLWRVKRYLKKINGEIEDIGNAYYFDDMHSFFIHCYQLKDYIENELDDLKRPVEKFVHKHVEFSICEAICVNTKHFKANDSGLIEAKLKNPKTTIYVGTPNVEGSGSIENTMDIEYVDVGDARKFETKINALDLANDLVALWDKFFIENDLRNE